MATVTGDAAVDRVFRIRELEAALANPNISTIDGVARSKWNTHASVDEVFDRLTLHSEIRTGDIRVGRGSDGIVFAKIGSAYFGNIGEPDIAAIDTTQGRFVDTYKLKMAGDPALLSKARALAEFLGPGVKLLGAAGIAFALVDTNARASALYRNGDSRGAIKEGTGGLDSVPIRIPFGCER